MIYIPIASHSSSSPPPQGVPKNLIYFMKPSVNPVEYIERAIQDSFPGFDYKYKKDDSVYEVTKVVGKGWNSDTYTYRICVNWGVYDKVCIIVVDTAGSYGDAHINSLAFAYSLEKILKTANVLIEG